MYWLRWHYHVKDIQGQRTELNETKKKTIRTETPTVSGRGQTAVILCITITIAYSHCQTTIEKVQSLAHDGTSSATVHPWQTTAGVVRRCEAWLFVDFVCWNYYILAGAAQPKIGTLISLSLLPFPPLSYFLPSFIFSPIPLNRSRGLGSAVSSPSRVQSGATRAIWCIFRSKNVYAGYQTNNDGYYFFIFHDKSLKNYLLQSWCLGTLMRVPEKEEKVPRLAPAWVIGCVAYAMHYWLHKIIKLAFFLCFL